MAGSTRFVVAGAVFFVVALYFVAFHYFKDPTPSLGSENALFDEEVPDVDGVLFWTADLQQADSISQLERIYMKEQPKISDGFYVPDYPYIRGSSYLRYFLRGANKNLPWLRQMIIVVSDTLIIPDYLNQTHPELLLVRHSEIMPKETLPCLNWRVAALYIHKIPDIAGKFIIFNEFDFIVKPIPYSNLVAADIEATNLFTHSIAPPKHSFDVEDIIETNTRNLVTLKQKIPFLETRGPVLIKSSVWKEMLVHYKDRLEETKLQVFRSKQSVNPVLLYCLHLINLGENELSSSDISAFLLEFDKDKDQVLEGMELRELAEKLKLKLETFPALFQNEQADMHLELSYVTSNSVIRSRMLAIHSRPDLRYQFVSANTRIVDPVESVYQTLTTELESKPADPISVYWIGPRAIFTKFYTVRGTVDNWLFETFKTAAVWEIELDRWYTTSLVLALACLIVAPFLCFVATKAMLVNSEPVHRD